MKFGFVWFGLTKLRSYCAETGKMILLTSGVTKAHEVKHWKGIQYLIIVSVNFKVTTVALAAVKKDWPYIPMFFYSIVYLTYELLITFEHMCDDELLYVMYKLL
jgi:hypothetical protein